MVLASIVTIVGLILVLVVYYRDPPIHERLVVRPRWDALPDPSDVARTEFPVAPLGYDPATVEVHFEALNRAYGDLLAAAPPEVIKRARQRATMRRGTAADQLGAATTEAASAPPAEGRQSRLASPEAADAEALRAEAALADLDTENPDR